MLWTERNLSISSGKRTWESAAKPRNWPALTSHPRLPPCSRVSFHTPLARCFSRKSCSQAVAVFIVVRDGCIDVIISHSISSVPIPLKVFIKCWHLLWLSTPEQKRTKLLKLSSVANSVNPHHFWEIYLQLSEEIALFLGKKKFFQTEKYPCVVLKCWKCFAIISYNVKQRHTVLSTFMRSQYLQKKIL